MKTKMLKFKEFFIVLKLSGVVFILLINVKMPTIVGILTFMSRMNFMFNCVEHEKKKNFWAYLQNLVSPSV